MRLIDADRLMDRLRGNVLIDVTPELEETIAQQPTAFDKEKVIEELVELRQKEYCDDDDEASIDGEEIYDRGRSQGRFEAYHNAMKIVEKGGIN